jgi:nucleoside permease NupC
MPKLRVLEKQQEQHKENMSENQETQTVQEETQEKPDKNMLQIVYEYVMSAINTIVPVLKWVYFVSKVYIIWITIHYISCQLYVHYCVPSGITGYLLSPFLVSSPQCKALRWAFYNGGNIIDNMWNYLGVWASTQLLKIE